MTKECVTYIIQKLIYFFLNKWTDLFLTFNSTGSVSFKKTHPNAQNEYLLSDWIC